MSTVALEALIDDLFTFIALSEVAPLKKDLGTAADGDGLKLGGKGFSKRNMLQLSHFGDVEPFARRSDISLSHIAMDYFLDAKPSDVSGDWDVSILTNGKEADVLFQIMRFRRIPLRELRGKQLYSPYACELALALILNDGLIETARLGTNYIGRDKDGFSRWASTSYQAKTASRDAESGDVYSLFTTLDEDPEITFHCNLALGIQFTRDYQWLFKADIGCGFRLCLPTDPQGAKHTFSDRDVIGDRKSALKHWVREHWRASRKQADMEHYVRQHLRGSVPFIWSGMQCELAPSPFDIRMNAKLEQQRKEMKREGKTLRVREDIGRLAGL